MLVQVLCRLLFTYRFKDFQLSYIPIMPPNNPPFNKATYFRHLVVLLVLPSLALAAADIMFWSEMQSRAEAQIILLPTVCLTRTEYYAWGCVLTFLHCIPFIALLTPWQSVIEPSNVIFSLNLKCQIPYRCRLWNMHMRLNWINACIHRSAIQLGENWNRGLWDIYMMIIFQEIIKNGINMAYLNWK